MKQRIGVIAVLAAVLWASRAVAQEGPFREVSFIPQWIPQAQFAGRYIAHKAHERGQRGG